MGGGVQNRKGRPCVLCFFSGPLGVVRGVRRPRRARRLRGCHSILLRMLAGPNRSRSLNGQHAPPQRTGSRQGSSSLSPPFRLKIANVFIVPPFCKVAVLQSCKVSNFKYCHSARLPPCYLSRLHGLQGFRLATLHVRNVAIRVSDRAVQPSFFFEHFLPAGSVGAVLRCTRANATCIPNRTGLLKSGENRKNFSTRNAPGFQTCKVAHLHTHTVATLQPCAVSDLPSLPRCNPARLVRDSSVTICLGLTHVSR